VAGEHYSRRTIASASFWLLYKVGQAFRGTFRPTGQCSLVQQIDHIRSPPLKVLRLFAFKIQTAPPTGNLVSHHHLANIRTAQSTLKMIMILMAKYIEREGLETFLGNIFPNGDAAVKVRAMSDQ
jgi:hypothetical protein